MTEFLTEYGMFLAKAFTLILLIILAFGALIFLFSRARQTRHEHLDVINLNDKYQSMSLTLKAATLSKKSFKRELKALQALYKKFQKTDTERQRIYVIHFKGDVRASEVTSLREVITAILSVVQPSDEVVVLLESAGGIVHDYGLAASQLQRIRNKGIKLTVTVDKVAASGGYMMACVADRIIAAPFAIIGSIGVIGQMPNFNRLLKNLDIDFEQLTAGEYKRTLTLFGENNDKGRAKAQQDIEETHRLFKEFVKENRPQLDIDAVSTGEHWYGKRALSLNLVDELCTSDDFLYAAAEQADLYGVNYFRRKGFWERLFSAAPSM